MRAAARTILVAGLALLAAPAAPADEARDVEARWVTPSPRIEIKETKGRFIIDPASRELRFVDKSRTRFSIPERDVVAIHYESTMKDGRAGDGYLTIHAASGSRSSRAESVKLRARDADAVLAQLASETGLNIDRGAPRRSFLAIPVRADVGDEVDVTEASGARARGRLTRIAPTFIEVVDSSAQARSFDSADVLRIEHHLDGGGKAGKAFVRGFLVSLGVAAGVCAILGAGFGEGGLDAAAVAGILGGAAVYGAVSAGVASLEPENFSSRRAIFVR